MFRISVESSNEREKRNNDLFIRNMPFLFSPTAAAIHIERLISIRKKSFIFSSMCSHNRMISYRVILIEIFFMYSTGQILDDINATNTSLVNDPSMNDTIFTESTSIPTQINDSIVSLVDQLNTYRDARILARIKQCDPNMRLNEICEKYSIDNETNFLVRQLNIDFLTFDDLVDRLLNRTIIDKFNQSCLINNDCVNNLSENDIQLTKNIIQTKGRSFCSLEQCHSRLVVFMDSCPTLGNLVRRNLVTLFMFCHLEYHESNGEIITDFMSSLQRRTLLEFYGMC